MTPEPALWNLRAPSSGWSKKRRKNGSSSSGLALCWFCLIVPCVEMFTTAGDTRLIIGESDGTGVSPTADGMAAGAAAQGPSRNANATRGAIAERRVRNEEARDMGRFRSSGGPALILMGCGPGDAGHSSRVARGAAHG